MSYICHTNLYFFDTIPSLIHMDFVWPKILQKYSFELFLYHYILSHHLNHSTLFMKALMYRNIILSGG